VKKNVKETYGGAEEVRDLMLKRSLLYARKKYYFLALCREGVY